VLGRSIVRPKGENLPTAKQVFSLTEQPKKQPYAWFPRVQKLCERAIVGAVRLHKR
jgi:hypothetical protein